MSGNVESVSGTKEWASTNVNIGKGCKHNCRYCYAYTMAKRFKRVKDHDHWGEGTVLNKTNINKGYNKRNGTIMFPTTHDITPDILVECIYVIEKMLRPGNTVLIVSKPHFECIKAICDQLGYYKDQILFRFTIGSFHDHILGFWEPGAPSFDERLEALKYAYDNGFKTSVSCEPFLDGDIIELFYKLEPFVTDSIWIGKMNRMETRIEKIGWTDREWGFYYMVKDCQTDSQIFRIYEVLKDDPKIRWKESCKKILGLELAPVCGMDI